MLTSLMLDRSYEVVDVCYDPCLVGMFIQRFFHPSLYGVSCHDDITLDSSLYVYAGLIPLFLFLQEQKIVQQFLFVRILSRLMLNRLML